MKNRYYENLKKSAKLYHRNKPNSLFINGVIQLHNYETVSKTSLSWWDDVVFILNNYRVLVAWIHPRQGYQDFIASEVHKNSTHQSINLSNMMAASTPNHIKVGKSRKKISTYTAQQALDFSELAIAYRLAFEVAEKSIQYHVKPYIKTQWSAKAYLVNICAPIEVRDHDDLQQLVVLVKRLLKRETTLDSVFPNYLYTKKQWLNDRSNLGKKYNIPDIEKP